MKTEAIDAMEALFAFSEAMSKGVTMQDLADVMTMAIKDGHDMLRIQLAMALEVIPEPAAPEPA